MAEIVEKPKPFSAVAKEAAQRVFRHENAVLAGVLIGIIAVLAGITHGGTITRSSIASILLRGSATGVAAIGQTFVILTAGIDVSVGGMAMVCMCLGGALMSGAETGVGGFLGQAIVPMGVAILIMLLAGIGGGSINGFLVSRVGMPALIVTLAMWQVARGGALGITKGFTIMYLPESLAFLGQGRIAGVPVPFIIFIALAAVAYFVLYHTTFGKSVYAVGGNPVSAWLSGIKTKNILLWVYIISGFLAGLAGLIIMARGMSASILSISGLEMDSIAAVVIGGISLAGGRGTLIGAMIGVVILSVISNGMNVIGVGPAMQDIVRGVIIIAAVAIDYIRRRG